MRDAIDGRCDDAEGRSKLFIRRREGESDEAFTSRAMNIMYVMSDILPLEQVVMSIADDWEKPLTSRWLEARHRTYPNIHLRVTVLPSAGGGAVGHLVVDHDDQQVADDWGDSQDGGILLPRAEQGRISKWSAALWRLAHGIRGLADQYDAALGRSGVIVEQAWL
jgi:hypothetical protein